MWDAEAGKREVISLKWHVHLWFTACKKTIQDIFDFVKTENILCFVVRFAERKSVFTTALGKLIEGCYVGKQKISYQKRLRSKLMILTMSPLRWSLLIVLAIVVETLLVIATISVL